jgi:hypothetical protein
MINPRKRIVWIVYLTFLCVLLICCNKRSEREAAAEIDKSGVTDETPATQPSETPEEQEAEPDPQEVPVAEDFEGEVEATVTEDNYLDELKRLEKEIERE